MLAVELVNQTALPAELSVGDLGQTPDGVGHRSGCLVVKATFEAEDGRVTLVDADPVPVLREPVETALGTLPQDVRPRLPHDLEIVVLAAAHAPDDQPVEQMEVSVSVGSLRDTLRVSGDREWVHDGSDWFASEPIPFRTMPLGWERAYGGTVEVWLDDSTVVPASDPLNPRGRGTNPTRLARRLAAGQAAPGFPRTHATHKLPNIEAPTSLVSTPDDEVMPRSWATVPPDVLPRLHAMISKRHSSPEALAEELRCLGDEMPALRVSAPGMTLRSPSWPLDVEVDGCTPNGPWLFRLPRLRVLMDYQLGPRSSSAELTPTTLVLLPSERRCTLSYEHWFRFAVDQEQERSIRIRTEDT